jgi:putative Holliday junction resolvase
MEVKDYIGLDVGKARTGFARGSELAKLAEALKTVPTDQAIETLKELVKPGVAGVVVGLPRNLRGEDTGQTAWVRQWVDKAKQEIQTVFYWQDEALTSKLAEAETINKGKIKDTDSLAARIILQDFLDSPDSMRVIC